MNCFELKSPLGVILLVFFVVYNGARPVSGSSCKDITEQGYCAVDKVSILTHDDANKFPFPKEKLIMLRAPNILKASQALCGRLPKVVQNLEIYDGFVPELCIKSTLSEFKAERNLARKVIIDDTNKYRLEFMVISNNMLRSVPKNITRLTNLVKLHLHGNEIETVNMDNFKDMTRLQVLLLYGNKIFQIDTKIPITLPELRTLDLSSNLLENLSSKLWNLPNLVVIDLQKNKFRKLEQLLKSFIAFFGHNPWSCTWLNQTIEKNPQAVKFFSQNKDKSCPGKQLRGICCEDSLDDKIIELNEEISSLKDEINWIKERLNKNRALIDDVVEDLYLEKMEKQET